MLRRNGGPQLRREAPAAPAKPGASQDRAPRNEGARRHLGGQPRRLQPGGGLLRSAHPRPALVHQAAGSTPPPMWSRVRPASAGTRWRTAPCSGEVGVDAEVVLGAGDVQTPVHGAAEGPSANRPRQRRGSAQSWKRWRGCMSSHTTPTPCNTAPNGSSRQWRELPSQSPSSPGRPLTCRRAHGTEFLLLGR